MYFIRSSCPSFENIFAFFYNNIIVIPRRIFYQNLLSIILFLGNRTVVSGQ